MTPEELAEAEAVLAALAPPRRPLRYAIAAPTPAIGEAWYQLHHMNGAMYLICFDQIHMFPGFNNLHDLAAVILVNEDQMGGPGQTSLAADARELARLRGCPVITGRV